MKKTVILFFGLMIWVSAACASSFVVKSVRIEGLRGLPQDTVYAYLPIQPGDKLTTQKSDKILQKLYHSGFFDHVSLAREGNTLIVSVTQRPIISGITYTGNDKIPNKQFKKVLAHMGFVRGSVFNPVTLKNLKTSLINEYSTLGMYNARINIEVKKEKRDRVAVSIQISEGVSAKIRQVQIVGNHLFPEQKLLDQLVLQPFSYSIGGLIAWFRETDKYSPQKLDASLEKLRSFYFNRGYMQFRVLSHEVSLSPDKKSVYVVIRIKEGPQFRVSGEKFTGRLVLPKSKLQQLVELKKGQVFSRQAVIASDKQISAALSDKGYFDASVQVLPKMDPKKKTVFVTFKVTPGHKVYIHHVRFVGNFRTNDETLRRESPLMEGGLLSGPKLKASKRDFMLLPFIKHVDISTKPVPGHSNERDVVYNVKERPAAQLQGGVSYSSIDGIGGNASIQQKNFMGTGNSMGLAFNISKVTMSGSFNYYNPYATVWGVGRGFSVYGSRFKGDKADVSDYSTSVYGTSLTYSFPMLNNNSSLQLGGNFEYTELTLENSPAVQLARFVADHGKNFYKLQLVAGFTYQGLDRYLFPTNGIYQSISLSSTVPVGKDSLQYYKAGYTLFYYRPLYKSFIARIRAHANYGNGYGDYSNDLPFFKNYYVGGIDTVPGYGNNSLGPRDSKGDSLGGNVEVDAMASLIFPNPISKMIRTSVFFAGGNVYQNKLDLGSIRYSAGVEVDWQMPFAMIRFTLAQALNARRGDDKEVFAFAMGSSI